MTPSEQEMLVEIGRSVGIRVVARPWRGSNAVQYGTTVTADPERAARDLMSLRRS